VFRQKLKSVFRATLGLLAWLGVFVLTDTLCLFQAFFGVPCPGCGLTRATLALFTGRVADAIFWHPLVFVTLPLIPYLAFRDKLMKKFSFPVTEKYIVLGVGSMYVITYATRMILLFPHTPPMTLNENALVRIIFRAIAGMLAG